MVRRGLVTGSLVVALVLLQRTSLARQEEPSPTKEEENPFAEPAAEEVLFRQEEIVTQVSKRAQSAREAPANVYVIEGEDLRRYGYRTIFEALQQVPGLFVSDDTEFRSIGLRGPAIVGDFDTRVLFLLDGHPLNERARGTATGSDLAVPIDLVDHIEVAMGPGSVVHGTSAFFGVVNIVTKGASELRGGQLVSSLGSRDTYGFNVAYGSYLAPDLEAVVSASYDSTNGTTERIRGFDRRSSASDERFRDAYVRVRWGEFALAARTSRHTRQQQGAPFGANFDSPRNVYRDKKNWVEASWSPRLGENGSLRLRAYVDRYRFDDFLDFSPFVLFRDKNESRTYGGEAMVTFRIAHGHTLSGGVELQRTTASFRSWVPDLVVTAAGEDTFGVLKLFVEDDYALTDSLRLVTGLQYNKHELFDSGFSPRVALIYTPSERDTWKLIYSEGFRNPTFIEAFNDDGSALLQNPNLSSERVRSAELVYQRQLGDRGSLTFSGWYSKVDDLIQQLPVIFQGRPRLQFQNVQGFRVYGVEAGGKYRLPGGTRMFANLTFQDERGAPLVNFPHWIANGGVSVPVVDDRVFLSGTVHAVAKREGGAFSDDSPSYALVNLTLLLRRFPLENTETTLGVFNLFDEAVYTPTPLSFLPDLLRSQRRALGVKMLVRF